MVVLATVERVRSVVITVVVIGVASFTVDVLAAVATAAPTAQVVRIKTRRVVAAALVWIRDVPGTGLAVGAGARSICAGEGTVRVCWSRHRAAGTHDGVCRLGLHGFIPLLLFLVVLLLVFRPLRSRRRTVQSLFEHREVTGVRQQVQHRTRGLRDVVITGLMR